MKKIYTLLALALLSGSVMAQSKDGVKFGIRGGVNLASIAYSGSGISNDIKNASKPTTSYYFGGFVDIPISDVVSVQPGLSLSGKGGKFDYNVTGPGGVGSVVSKTSLMYIEMPINAVFNFSGFYIGVGPYLGYGIAGRTFTETKVNGVIVPGLTDPERDVEFGSEAGNDSKPFDFGANALAGYRLENGLSIGLNYGFGVANNYPDTANDVKASNRVFSILVGFSF